MQFLYYVCVVLDRCAALWMAERMIGVFVVRIVIELRGLISSHIFTAAILHLIPLFTLDFPSASCSQSFSNLQLKYIYTGLCTRHLSFYQNLHNLQSVVKITDLITKVA